MKVTIQPGERYGQVKAPASKSVCHRLLILAALGKSKTDIYCGEISADIQATASCLRALGAEIIEHNGALSVAPVKKPPENTVNLYCGESGSTLRFLLPVAGVLGIKAVFHMDGRLAKRPVTELTDQLKKNGMYFETGYNTISCHGRLRSGNYTLSGEVSSQYISALLMTLPLLKGDSRLNVTGCIQSQPYINISLDILKSVGIGISRQKNEYLIFGSQQPEFKHSVVAEGDYSAAAFFLCAGALSEKGITVYNLNKNSVQGDRKIMELLKTMGAETRQDSCSATVRKAELKGTVIDASQIPDLVPAVAAVAALCDGETRIINAGRLRLKESDRLSTTGKMLSDLGAYVEELDDGLVIRGRASLAGGITDSYNDHRIAMAAAVAAAGCKNEVTIGNAQAVKKSYPRFWSDFESLGKEKT